jgi:hypothetical protein
MPTIIRTLLFSISQNLQSIIIIACIGKIINENKNPKSCLLKTYSNSYKRSQVVVRSMFHDIFMPQFLLFACSNF